MATPSEVIAGLDDAARTIRTERQALSQAKARVGAAEANLAAIPATFAAVIEAVNQYGSTDPFEAHAKALLAKLSDEYAALKTQAGQAKADLAEYTEF